MAAASAATADPDPESLRPAITRRGWQLDFTGYLQTDWVAWSQDSVDELDPATGEPLNDERFAIPRARLRAEARRDAFVGVVELDGNTFNGVATARLLGAHASWSAGRPSARGAPLVVLTAGLFKTPFGAEVPASERDKAFLEPPAFARALFPFNYDAGVMAQGSYGVARWSLAMMNGSPVGDAQWHGKDPTSSYDFIGRVGAVVDGPRKLRVEGGVSVLAGTGLHPGTPPTKDQLQWIDENQDGIVQITELQVVQGSPGEASQTYSRDAIGADLQVHWCLCKLGNGTAFAEAALSTNLDRGIVYSDPIAQSRDLRQLGYAVGVVQDFGPYALAGIRYDRYDADRDAFEREGVSVVGIHKLFSTLAVMVSARWHDARFLVQYNRERDPFGRGDDGAPITRSADRLTFRTQVGF